MGGLNVVSLTDQLLKFYVVQMLVQFFDVCSVLTQEVVVALIDWLDALPLRLAIKGVKQVAFG